MKHLLPVFLAAIACAAPATLKQPLATALYFEPNQGQFPQEILFAARGPRYTTWITAKELRIATARIGFAHGEGKHRAYGVDRQIGISNYYTGADSSKWTLNVPSFAKARIDEIYPGVDVLFYAGRSQELEYDLIVKPGADVSQIHIDFDPLLKPRKGAEGEISLNVPGGMLRHEIPLVHQSGKAVSYKTRFDGTSLRFDIARYDAKQPLIIDPTIAYNTYLGDDVASVTDVAVDSTGAAYISGNAPLGQGGERGFVTKLGATPVQGVYPRIYTQYFGSTGRTFFSGIDVDSTGAAYVTGSTNSPSFPVKGAFQTAFGGGNADAIVVKIAAFSPYPVVYASYFGGSGLDSATGIAVMTGGSAVITGTTTSTNMTTLRAAIPSLPVTLNARPTSFALRISDTPLGDTYPLLYSTYLSTGGLAANAIAVDSFGAAYIVGNANSADSLATKNAQQPTSGGRNDAFVLKIEGTPSTSSIYEFGYATFLGGAGDDLGAAITVAPATGIVTVVGSTTSSNFPVLRSLQPTKLSISTSGFVVKLNGAPNSGGTYTMLYGSYFGGTAGLNLSGVASDPAGATHLIGIVAPDGTFPAKDSWFAETGLLTESNSSSNGFVAKILLPEDSGPPSLVYSTRIGTSGIGEFRGLAVDSAGSVYLAGQNSRSLPAIAGTPFPAAPSTSGFAMKLTSQASLPSVSIDSSEKGKNFTVVGEGCNPGTYQFPTAFFWPNGTACSVTVPTNLDESFKRVRFQQWNDSTAATVRLITATATPATYRANYTSTYPVTVSSTDPSKGTTTPSGTEYHPAGTAIRITATPTPGSAFGSWNASGLLRQGQATTLMIVAPGVNNALATFVPAVTGVSASQFVPVTPCRIADTRAPGLNVIAPGAVAAKTVRDFAIGGASICGIPADATAYSLNVTVVPKGPLGYLTIFPAGQTQPVVSTLNSLDGRVKANAAVVPAGANGRVSVFVTDESDIVLDVNGYFVAPRPGSLQYYPIIPCRAIDTRNTGLQPLAPLVTQTVRVATACNSIPTSARAVALNATVLPTSKLGFLRIQPEGGTATTSTLNAVTGTIVANAAIVPIDPRGGVDVFATEQTHLILDVNGYFAPPDAAPNGLNFYPAAPCRLFDSRDLAGNGPLIGGQTNYIGGPTGCRPQPAAKVFSLNATVIPQTPVFGYLALYPPDVPAGLFSATSTLNAIDGALTSNAAFTEAVNGSIIAFAGDRTHLVLDINGFFAP